MEAAAVLAGMSRPALMKHVRNKNIKPDITSGKRQFFYPATIAAFNRGRKANGTKKRGPRPQGKR